MQTHCPESLAVDFGTSSSAAAVCVEGDVSRVPLEIASDTIPTAVFFNSETKSACYGTDANKALSDGEPGRYMRSLKSMLGTTLMSERRWLNGRPMDGFTIITDYISTMKQRAEAHCGRSFSQVLAGRPVHFHSRDQKRDMQAEADLKTCFERAGFTQVDFMYEPVAAALHERHTLKEGTLGLVVDIGGGTSDFTLFRSSGHAAQSGSIEVLQSHGIRLGGTDFDQKTSMRFIMPFLGHGHKIRRTMGDEILTAPNAIFSDLSTWEKIPFLYNSKTEQDIRELIYLAVDTIPFERLRSVIEHELGHELAMLTEATKIALNSTDQDQLTIELGLLERGLETSVSVTDFDNTILKSSNVVRKAIEDTLTMAGQDADAIDHIIEVGGGGKMKLIREVLKDLCPGAEISSGATFTAVVNGLALATEQNESLKHAQAS